MRTIQTQDVFNAVRLINKLNFKEDLKEIMTAYNGGGNVSDLGCDILFRLMGKAAEKDSEEAVYEFLSCLLEVTSEEVRTMDLFELVENLEKCADPEKWKVFFGHVSALTKK